jgi:hypothetical protein
MGPKGDFGGITDPRFLGAPSSWDLSPHVASDVAGEAVLSRPRPGGPVPSFVRSCKKRAAWNGSDSRQPFQGCELRSLCC